MMNRRALRAPILLALPLALLVGACTEDLETGGACPSLCPGQELEILEAVIDPAIVFDTTVAGFPLQGFEQALLLASRGDTLDVRAIVRFDTLIRGFRPPNVDTVEAVQMIDSATLNIRLLKSRLPLPASFTIEAYDVTDTTIADTLPTGLLPFFRGQNLLGSVVVDSAGLTDTTTIRIPIDTVRLLDAIQEPTALFRIGLRIVAAEPVEVFVRSSEEGALGPRLRYRVSPDTNVSVANIAPSSSTPRTPLFVAGDYEDYSLVAAAPPLFSRDHIAVGGLPALRPYLRFDLPLWLTDSSAVLRARLELVQDPFYGLNEDDTLVVKAQMVLAGHAVTDVRRAMQLLAPEGFFVIDSLVLTPGDSGVRRLELNALVRQWRTADGVRPIPSALVLKSTREALTATGVQFFGLTADPALRPRLRVSYVPAIPFGQP